MTQDEIIEMARQARLMSEYDEASPWVEDHEITQYVEAFAKLVEDKVRQEIIEKNAPVIKKVNEHIKELQDAVKAEREACAKVCDDMVKSAALSYLEKYRSQFIADAIRARGEA
jgi:CHASE3 domain sensor protein